MGVGGNISRYNLFGGNWGGQAEAVRPPWAPPEAAFTDRCTACGNCVAACPRGILITGRAGYPRIDFARAGCDFCAACAAACPESLLNTGGGAPWNIRAYVSDDCLAARGVTCRVCAEWCDAGAIRFRLEVRGRAWPEIGEAACTGCGECIAACPVNAIAMENCA